MSVRACIHHPQTAAEFVCDWCAQPLCSQCVAFKSFGRTEVPICACGGRCVPIASPAQAPRRPYGSTAYRVAGVSQTQPRWILDAFTYPLQGQGILLLTIGTIVFSFLSFVSSISMFGYIGHFLLAGYLCAFYQNVVQTSADGEGELPNWPDFTDFFLDIVAPMVQIMGCFVLCLAPAAAYRLWVASVPTDPIFWCLLLAGLMYLPMGLMAVSLTQSLKAMNPIVLVPSMRKVIADYAVVVAVLMVSAGLSSGVKSVLVTTIPIAGSVLAWLASMYFATVQFRLLGLLYYRHQDELDWF